LGHPLGDDEQVRCDGLIQLCQEAYTLALPAAQTSVTVTVEGLGKDIDVAINPGKAVKNLSEFSDARIYDTSAATRHTHTLRNVKARTVHIAVLNLLESTVQYELRAK
jgi:predicted small secreted protein